ncbi:MAG TPA: glycosyltransferase [Terriglobales bacterium]|nr:glycosyltransferase [Terriglobales bacterium]
MKILWVKSGGLIPADHGGRIRSYNLLKQLARHHEVTFFTFYPEEPNDIHAELDNVFHRVVRYTFKQPPAKGFQDAIAYGRNLLSLRPYSLTKYCRPGIRERLAEVMRKERFDVVICDFLISGGVIPWETDVPIVLFTHNVEAQIWERSYKLADNPIWKTVCWREYKTMARLEERLVKDADHVLAVSEDDKRGFLPYVSPEKISVIPTGVDPEYFQPVPGVPEKPNSLVFTGSMDWLPNDEGILYFVEQILSLVQQRVPDVSLTVVGRKPSERLKTLAAANPAIRVTGRVEDVRPYMTEASVYVVPLLIGSGTRLKVFEAMAMAKAMVSTPLGTEGLPVTHGENSMLADNPKDFADHVVSLLRNREERERIGKNARNFVEANFSWEAVGKVLEQVLQKVTNASAAVHTTAH